MNTNTTPEARFDSVPALEAEIIGMLFHVAGAVEAAALALHDNEGLRPGHFTDPICRDLFAGALEHDVSGEGAPDWVRICESVGPEARDLVLDFADAAPRTKTYPMVAGSARRLKAEAERRNFLALCESVKAEVELGYLAPDMAQARLSQGTTEAPGVTFRTVAEIIESELLDDDKRRNRFIRTGVHAIDDMIGGLARGGLTILAAGTGRGKSSFAFHLIRRAAGDHQGRDNVNRPLATDHNVGVFTLEMGTEEVAGQLVASSTRRPAREIHGHETLTRTTRDALEAATMEPWASRVHVAEVPGLDLDRLRLALAHAVKVRRCNVVVIDYLQLMRAPKSDTRDQAIGAVTRELKALARLYRIPIVVLAQLNRKADEDVSKPPRPSHLRESGSIEQDASEVLFLHGHRLELNLAPGLEVETEALASPDDIYVDVILSKSRFGKLGKRSYRWRRSCNLFIEEDLIGGPYPGHHDAHGENYRSASHG